MGWAHSCSARLRPAQSPHLSDPPRITATVRASGGISNPTNTYRSYDFSHQTAGYASLTHPTSPTVSPIKTQFETGRRLGEACDTQRYHSYKDT